MKIIKNSLKMRNPSTTEFESINGFVGESGVHVGPNAPLGSGVDLWINSSDTSSFNLPEIKDDEINETDTWSSKQISNTKSYSTEEQFTGGYWIDGKPIYKKVIYSKGAYSNSTNLTEENFSYIDTLIHASGTLVRTDGVKMVIPAGYSTAGYCTSIEINANGALYFYQGGTITTDHIIVILEYTKKED